MEYTAALRRGIAMVVVSGYCVLVAHGCLCACVYITRVRQVQDKFVCVRSEEERKLRFTKMTARFVLKDYCREDSPLQKLHPEVKIVSS